METTSILISFFFDVVNEKIVYFLIALYQLFRIYFCNIAVYVFLIYIFMDIYAKIMIIYHQKDQN